MEPHLASLTSCFGSPHCKREGLWAIFPAFFANVLFHDCALHCAKQKVNKTDPVHTGISNKHKIRWHNVIFAFVCIPHAIYDVQAKISMYCYFRGRFPVRPKLSDELLIPGDLLQSEQTMTPRGGAGQQFALLFLVGNISKAKKKKNTGKKSFLNVWFFECLQS